MKFLRNLFRRKPIPLKIEGEGASRVITGSKPDLDAIGDLILKQLRESGMIGPDARVEVRGTMIERDGLKPPSDSDADGWTWDAWSKEMGHMAFPGWSPCRFAHRTSPEGHADRARFVFGITRGPFGLWQQRFDVCGLDTEDGEWKQERATLVCLTHLPSGIGMGIFNGKDAAARAADTAIRTCPQLPDAVFDQTLGSPWSGLMSRTSDAWRSLGIIPAENAHAHDPSTGTGPYMIMGLAENLEHGKPEKLS